ncbi:glycosyltransferase [Christiangramia sp.]|uniref:CgeB family protein n=1 Tax=Christiangramia sp. TaxID=1931228 RepID=UPI002634DA15|nr:glycosyltransferase [Christiangramia sp.]
MKKKLNIAFFGSSIVSAYWNGAATYYRGIVKALHKKGHSVTFYEPNILDRQKHRDIEDPEWCEVVVYEEDSVTLRGLLRKAQEEADVLIKASGVGVFDELIEKEITQLKRKDNLIVFWDVDAPATLDRMENDQNDPFREVVPDYDLILTYGGGTTVQEAYKKFGAKECIPIYNALDRDIHFRVEPNSKFDASLAFLGNRLPDRESRVEEFFLQPAKNLDNQKFILGGSGWGDKELPKNVNYLGHVYTKDHNAFNCTPKAVLNISRDSMARYGFSPATRVFEAAGSGACIITDYWKGISQFFEPGKEILVAKNGEEVKNILKELDDEEAKAIGDAAYERVLAEHTYERRVEQLEKLISEKLALDKKEPLNQQS